MIAYLIGLSAGLVPALSTGPVFLTLVQHAIDHGFRKAVYFIAGVALTDTSIILLTWLGLSQISGGSEPPAQLSIGGGILLILFGLIFIFKKESEQQPVETSSTHLQKFGLFTQAIMLNAINPIIWGFWAAISNYAIAEFNDTTSELLFFAGVLNMVWITDVLKAYYAQNLNKYLNERFKKYLRIGIGLVLAVLGAKLLVEYYLM
ncbi:Threonine/homoserine/homoserine lactone efflux protein [Reichenbachiella faecimaris]|uniref:Threonine/homoserine/homoserine lactone efflux protein n=1 Tax=Reichenbachiella faecimaris TaxID=692418 RepID=A0A1W2GR08_REIFA|nr:LysE family transporter [Reichenbachiella faecimaris]SMD38852.1 Threonine/homoserine/homoserine lactone efflux protein [Reichenbachiella faecimaris]